MTSTVNVPTNTKLKEQDVNTKLQLYGIYAAFANGKVPSNKQIDIALNSFLQSRALSKPSNKLSKEGHELIADVRDVVEQAKQLVLTKNDGNLLQNFIWHCSQLDAGAVNTPNAPVDADTAKQHGNEALDGLRTLGTLLISNGQFRKLLNDALTLAKSVASDAAANAASTLAPSDEALAQIDRPAEDNTWHETPDLSISKLKDQVKSSVPNVPLGKKDAKDVLNAAQQQNDPTAAAQAGADVAQKKADKVDQNVSNEDKEKAKKQVEEKKQQAREKRDQYKRQTKEYFNKKIPQERREQTIWRLKKMVVEIQGHEDYTEAVETLLRLAETYTSHGKSLAEQGSSSVKDARGDNHLKAAEDNLKLLIERFANGTSTKDFFDALNQIYVDADQDPELKQWFRDVNSYIRRSLQEQGYVLQDASTDEGNRLYDRGQFLLRERYRSHTDRVVDEVKFLADQFAADPQSKRFGESTQKLFLDLGQDENGKAVFKKHLVKDLSDVILPAVFENIRYVPIPRIEYSDPMMDAIVENLVIEGDNLAPNALEIKTDNYFKWGRKSESSKNAHRVELAASGIQCDLRDISYYLHKKEGFPSIKDTGIMDVYLGGEGFSFKVALATADKSDKQRFFKVDKVSVTFKHMNIKVKKSKYKILFSIAKPLLLKVMRPVVQKVLEQQIKQSIDKLDELAYRVHEEAKKAQSEVMDDPENAPNVFNRYYQAGREQILKGKKKGEDVANNTTVNVAVTKHDSIFKDISLPGGISTKATEYKDLAATGDKWESPVFTIGHANQSSNIPAPPQVTQKPHDVTEAKLKDPVPEVPTAGAQAPTSAPLPGTQQTEASAAAPVAGFAAPAVQNHATLAAQQAFTTQSNGLNGVNGSKAHNGIGQPPAGYTGNVQQ